MKRLLATEPALALGLLQAAVALAVSFGLDLEPGQVGAITAFVAAFLALVLRQVVVAPSTVVEVARQTAETLSDQSAGAVGTVTKSGEKIIDSVVAGVGGLVPALAPKVEVD